MANTLRIPKGTKIDLIFAIIAEQEKAKRARLIEEAKGLWIDPPRPPTDAEPTE